ENPVATAALAAARDAGHPMAEDFASGAEASPTPPSCPRPSPATRTRRCSRSPNGPRSSFAADRRYDLGDRSVVECDSLEMVDDPVGHAGQGVDLFGAEQVDEVLPYRGHVVGRGGTERPAALVGQHQQ